MAQDRPTLKGYFENGDKPNEQEFAELIDSYVHKDEDDYVQNLTDATTTAKGIARRATVAETTQGDNDTAYTTPAGVKASIAANAPVRSVNGVGGDVTITIPEVTIPDTGWQTPNLSGSSFANADAPLQGIRYRKVNNVVYIEGAVKGGNNNQSIFTLPVGFKPSKTLVFSSVLNTGPFPTAVTVGRIDINEAGQVIPATVGSTMTSISGISFVVD